MTRPLRPASLAALTVLALLAGCTSANTTEPVGISSDDNGLKRSPCACLTAPSAPIEELLRMSALPDQRKAA